jgi:acyl carrier protein
MDTLNDVRNLLRSALQLGDRADQLGPDSALLGGIAEFDSMAVVTVITQIEEQFGVRIDDDEISADTFATVGSLVQFLEGKLAR